MLCFGRVSLLSIYTLNALKFADFFMFLVIWWRDKRNGGIYVYLCVAFYSCLNVIFIVMLQWSILVLSSEVDCVC